MMRKYPGLEVVGCTAWDFHISEFVLPVFEKVLPLEHPFRLRSNRKSMTYWMTNGSVIRFKAYDDPDKIRGWQCHVLYFPECNQLGDNNAYKGRNIWSACLNRQRSAGAFMPRIVLADTNPSAHNWIWEMFIRGNAYEDEGLVTIVPASATRPETKVREYEKEVNGFVYYTVSSGTDSNAFLPPGYLEKNLADLEGDPELKARMLEGSFTPALALVYGPPIFSEKTHIIDEDAFLAYWGISDWTGGFDPRRCIPRGGGEPGDWKLWLGIDSAGNYAPWAVEFYLQTPEDEHGMVQYVCIDEIYVSGVGWDYIADAIMDKVEGWDEVSYWIDPIHSKQGQYGGMNYQAIYDNFRKRGIPVQTMKHQHVIEAGVTAVKDLLRPDRSYPFLYGDDKKGNDPEDIRRYDLWDHGASRLYYLGKRLENGSLIAYAKHNMMEKGVYRRDTSKMRPPKAHMEGLKPEGPEKIIGQQDHAQTAEMFAVHGMNPRPLMRERSNQRLSSGHQRRAPYTGKGRSRYENSFR